MFLNLLCMVSQLAFGSEGRASIRFLFAGPKLRIRSECPWLCLLHLTAERVAELITCSPRHTRSQAGRPCTTPRHVFYPACYVQIQPGSHGDPVKPWLSLLLLVPTYLTEGLIYQSSVPQILSYLEQLPPLPGAGRR